MSDSFYTELVCRDENGKECIVDPFITALANTELKNEPKVSSSFVGKTYELVGDYVHQGRCGECHIPTAFNEVVETGIQQSLFS
jgi:hypothetical protein